MLAVMVAALVLVLAAPALAGPEEDAKARRELLAGRTARAADIQNGETKENLEQVVVNHFGSPNQGQVLIQTWVEPDWTEFEAVDLQGAVQAVKIRRAGAGFAKRVAIRVELYGDGNLQASSSTVNTGDVNGTAFVQTPEAGELTHPGPAVPVRPRLGPASPLGGVAGPGRHGALGQVVGRVDEGDV
jgi:hypothetical protein